MGKNSKEYMRAYYHLHKEKWLKPKVKCECGIEVRAQNVIKHEATDMHKLIMDTLNKHKIQNIRNI